MVEHRSPKPGAAGSSPSAPASKRRKKVIMGKTAPLKFLKEVRQEVSKVTWPTRKETILTTAMVFVMVFILSLFFLGVDQVLSFGVRWILGL